MAAPRTGTRAMTLHGTHLVVALGLLCELGHVNILLAAVVGHCDLLMMDRTGV